MTARPPGLAARPSTPIRKRALLDAFKVHIGTPGEFYLDVFCTGFHAAVAHLAGINVLDVTPAVSRWAYPRFPLAEDGCPEDEERMLRWAGGHTYSISVAAGVTTFCHTIDDRDFWFIDNDVFGERAATPQTRLRTVQQILRAMGRDTLTDYEIHVMPAEIARKLDVWARRRTSPEMIEWYEQELRPAREAERTAYG